MMTDHVMPGMTEVELAAASREVRPSLPILLATGMPNCPTAPSSICRGLQNPITRTSCATGSINRWGDAATTTATSRFRTYESDREKVIRAAVEANTTDVPRLGGDGRAAGNKALRTRIWRCISAREACDLMDFQGKECYIRREDKLWPHALKP
jgi:hypothetical protein